MNALSLTARWVFPVAGPPVERGVVAIRDGRIEAVHPRGERTADLDLGNVALVPGFVNPHTHLDLSGARGVVPPTTADRFTDWLRGVIAFRRGRTAEQVRTDIRAGIDESLRSGVTLLGDIAVDESSAAAIRESPLRAVVFREVIGLSAERFEMNAAAARQVDTPLVRRGLSPHAPYSVNHDRAMTLLAEPGPKCVHLAESLAEMELLASRSGPFVEFLSELGIWNPDAIRFSAEEFVRRNLAPDSPRLFIHVNHLPPGMPFGSNQSIVYCPRTHAAFGHPPHPFREFVRRGVRIAFGTDSLASNPDLDILAEARFVHARDPDIPGETLLRTITLAGAEALGWASETGSLEAGKSADAVAIPLPNREGEPHELLLADHPGDRRTMFRGAWR